MSHTTRVLVAASLFLAFAAAVPAAEAVLVVPDVDVDHLFPTVMACDPVLGCYVIDVDLPNPSCSASGHGSGVRAECHGT